MALETDACLVAACDMNRGKQQIDQSCVESAYYVDLIEQSLVPFYSMIVR